MNAIPFFKKAVFLDRATVDGGDLDFQALHAVASDWRYFDRTLPSETLERVGDAELVVSNKVLLERSTLEQCRNLRLICIAATGTNNVDLEAARALGIPVTHVAGYSTPSVVQHLFALLLTWFCRLDESRAAVRDGAWQRAEPFCLLDYPTQELPGKRLGIVGYGTLGQAVGRVAEACGMELLLAQRPGGAAQPGRIALHELLPQVDVLSLHCPLTAETHHLIGAAELALMRRDALLMNTARGGIVDEQALADALRRGVIGGAAVDVLSNEPPREGNPLLAPDLPNLLLTPHVAWAGQPSRQRLLEEIAANVRAFLAGEVRNRVV